MLAEGVDEAFANLDLADGSVAGGGPLGVVIRAFGGGVNATAGASDIDAALTTYGILDVNVNVDVDVAADATLALDREVREYDAGYVGSLRKTGEGILVIAGPNTLRNGVNILAGTVEVESDENLVAAGAKVRLEGQTAPLRATGDVDGGRPLLLVDARGTIDVGSNAVSFGVASGDGLLTKRGTGELTLERIAGPGLYVAQGSASLFSKEEGVELTSFLADDYRLGYAVAGDVGLVALDDGPVAPGTLVVRLTLGGDANLDGSVTFADLLATAQRYGQTNRV